jgi:hypothetical protein
VLELFHTLPDPDSAAARRAVGELDLSEAVSFRNVGFDSHRAALAERGGKVTPALWDGVSLHEGLAAVLAALGRAARAR